LTSRPAIVSAARRVIDRDGWEKLTIRRLASDLGVGPTTLYHHIRDKQDLLTLLINDYIQRLDRPDLPEDPRDRIVVTAAAMHDALAGWPWAAEVLTADGFLGVLDASSLWMVEAILAAAREHGCTPAQSVHVFRSLWYYTVGEILVRTHSARRRPGKDHPLPSTPTFVGFDPDAVPHLSAIGGRWTAYTARDTFRDGLAAFVDGLLANPGPDTEPNPTPA
jgi:AcrR family transcriptional regulator